MAHPFERSFLMDHLKPLNVLEMEDQVNYYIAGVTQSHIYLGNYRDRLKLLVTDSTLTDTTYLNLINSESHEMRTATITVNPPNFYISDHILHKLYTGKLDNGHFQRFDENQFFIVGRAVPVSETAFVIRTWKDSIRESELAKQTSYPPYLQRAPKLLEKQIDGIFCTDGTLVYNEALSQLIYTYYYRNEFICTDTSMNLLYRGNTLDTVSLAGVKVAQVESEDKTTTSAPKIITNSASATYGPWLFIRSKLMASNEQENQFRNASVIDVYDLTKEGDYAFSFYLPKYKDHKAREFKILDNRIVAIYDRFLVIYDHLLPAKHEI